jgi:hypothetical protein
MPDKPSSTTRPRVSPNPKKLIVKVRENLVGVPLIGPGLSLIKELVATTDYNNATTTIHNAVGSIREGTVEFTGPNAKTNKDKILKIIDETGYQDPPDHQGLSIFAAGRINNSSSGGSKRTRRRKRNKRRKTRRKR